MNERQLRFIKALAKFLTKDEVGKSIELQMRKESAIEWSELRSATPLLGYYPGDEGLEQAENELIAFLKPSG